MEERCVRIMDLGRNGIGLEYIMYVKDSVVVCEECSIDRSIESSVYAW